MMLFTDATGLLGSAIAISVLVLRMPGISRMARPLRVGLLAALLAAMLLPLGGLPLAGYLRGVVGDLSITTLVLLCASVLRTQLGWPVLPGRDKLLLLLVIAAAGFYPLALGWGNTTRTAWATAVTGCWPICWAWRCLRRGKGCPR